MQETETDVILEAGEIRAAPIRTGEDGVPFMLRGKRIVSLERFMPAPVRARGTFRAKTALDAHLFVTRMQSPGTEVMTFWHMGRLTAYLNFHASPESAGWCDFKVTCWCSLSDAESKFKSVLRGKFNPTK